MAETPTLDDLRFVVFILNSKLHNNEGAVFIRLKDAKAYIRENVNTAMGDKYIIASFVEQKREWADLSDVTLVSKQTKAEQLKLFGLD